MYDDYREHDPWITLALAVVYQAAQDAQNGHPALAADAKQWLEVVGVNWCQVLDVPERTLAKWFKMDFWIVKNSQRNWRY
jgi:hypothetical protein